MKFALHMEKMFYIIEAYFKRYAVTITCILLFFIGWILAHTIQDIDLFSLSLSRKNIFSTYIPYSIFTFAFINPNLVSSIMFSLYVALTGVLVEPRIGSFRMISIIALAIILTSIIYLIVETTPERGVFGSQIIVSALSGALAILLWKQWKKFTLAERIIAFIIVFRLIGVIISVIIFKGYFHLYESITFGVGAIVTMVTVRREKVQSS